MSGTSSSEEESEQSQDTGQTLIPLRGTQLATTCPIPPQLEAIKGKTIYIPVDHTNLSFSPCITQISLKSFKSICKVFIFPLPEGDVSPSISCSLPKLSKL